MEGVADQVEVDAGLDDGLQQALSTTSGRPLSPPKTTKDTSRMPRFFRSVSTLIQNLSHNPPRRSRPTGPRCPCPRPR